MPYIYERVTPYDMERRAHAFGRYDQLGGYAGIHALHEYLETLAEDMGEPIELDIVALCCDWAHFDDICGAAGEYDNNAELADLLAEVHSGECDNYADLLDEILDWFQDRTTVLPLDNGGYLIQAF